MKQSLSVVTISSLCMVEKMFPAIFDNYFQNVGATGGKHIQILFTGSMTFFGVDLHK